MGDYDQFLKADQWVKLHKYTSDQQKNKPRPLVQKPYPEDATLIDLVPPETFTIGQMPLFEVIKSRKSHRYFTDAYLTLEELSFLLWATQGIRDPGPDGVRYYRNVPSGGNRHPFETYLSVHRVEGLEGGLYRYIPLEHKLLVLNHDPTIATKTSRGGRDQSSEKDGNLFYFQRDCAVFFIWTAIPYRTIWRYSVVAPKLIAIEAGHICQNLYLACGAIGAGACAIGALDRKTMDEVLGVDGEEEFTFYAAPVGKILEKSRR